MDRAQKREMVDELGQIFAQSGSIVVTQYAGLSVAEMTDLRRRMRQAGALFKVTKNRLAKIALDQTERAVAAHLFTGPTGIAFGEDPVAAPKVATEYAKENDNFIVLGGLIGVSALDAKGIEALAKMPSLEEMRAKLLGALGAPAGNLARTLNQPGATFVRTLAAPGRSLAGVLAAYAQAKEAA